MGEMDKASMIEGVSKTNYRGVVTREIPQNTSPSGKTIARNLHNTQQW